MSDACFISSSISECQHRREYERLLFSISCQIVHNRITAHRISLVIVCLHNYQLQPHIHLCQCWFPAVTLSRHVIIFFLQIQKHSATPFGHFYTSSWTLSNITCLVFFVEMRKRITDVTQSRLCIFVLLLLLICLKSRCKFGVQLLNRWLGYKPQVVLQCVHRSVNVG